VTVLGWLSVLIIWSLIGTVAMVLSLVFANPVAIGPVGVTLWFVVLYLVLSSILALGLYTIKTFLHLHPTGAGRLRYAWRQGMLLSGWITGLLALSSLHQLGLLDAILLALLLLIVEVYVRFRWP
jgi:hypothetical protein